MDRIADNVNPVIFEQEKERIVTCEEEQEDVRDPFDEREIFDMIRNITDPEHPLTLEQLRVIEEKNISVDNELV